MTQEEYESAVEDVISDLIVDVLPSPLYEHCWVEPLSLIRQMIKHEDRQSVRMVKCAMYGLLLAKLPVTDENIRWLIRDKQLGFDHENALFISGSGGEHKVDIYPAMNEYKDAIEAIHKHYHPSDD